MHLYVSVQLPPYEEKAFCVRLKDLPPYGSHPHHHPQSFVLLVEVP